MVEVMRIATDRHAPASRSNRDHLPLFPGEHVTNQIVLMKPLHDNDDRAGALVVQARQEGVVESFIDPPTLLLG
ncbi:MAG: hypothetical protein K0S56_1219 [Microvirga sp.]|nr:hypothetical protein [Microvirga sp.]